MTKWFHSSSRGLPYYINESQINEIDSYLLSIKPPSRVARLPRTLSQIGSYKGHEFNMFFTYYSPIILESYLPKEYYDHWLLLVNGIALLNCKESELSEHKIQRGSALLNDFSHKVESLYGRSSLRFNVHLLRHLELFVKRYGPLHLSSMSIFESFNSTIKCYVKSSFGVGLQIVKRYCRASTGVSTETHRQRADKSLQDKLSGYYLTTFADAIESLNITDVYKSVNVDNRYYMSCAGTRSQKRCNYLYLTDCMSRVFEVFFFVKSQGTMLAVGNQYELTYGDIQVDHIYSFSTVKQCVIDVKCLSEKVIRVGVSSTYFVRFINDVECNNE